MQPTILTIAPDAQATFVAAMTKRMAEVARQLSTWVADAPRTLAELEEHTLAVTKDLGQVVLAATCQLAASPAPAPHAPGTCGQAVPYRRARSADVLTVLGLISVERPIYWCRACGRTFAPFDERTGLCPGSISAGLDELLALLGAREDSFDAAAEVLQRLTLVRVCSNLARTATERLGRLLWTEAARRGVLGAGEVIAIGDGAHWIWNLVEEHFPHAVQIVDWYHASQYLWAAANAVYGEGTDLAKGGAGARLDDRWDGEVGPVLTAVQATGSTQDAVTQASTYFTNNQHRMRYAEYRARGIQIGSGVIESGCKHVIGARLKQAGMIWNVDGARAVGTVRTWLKGRRWAEAMALRPSLRRASQREVA